MTQRDLSRLTGVHPALVEALKDIFAEMDGWGHPMMVVEGVRTMSRQQALFAQGRTTSGPIVTNADGVHKRSNHQPHVDGWGHAVDCAFLSANHYAESHPWEQYGLAAEKHGLTWGGRWESIMDKPHVELPETDTKKA